MNCCRYWYPVEHQCTVLWCPPLLPTVHAVSGSHYSTPRYMLSDQVVTTPVSIPCTQHSVLIAATPPLLPSTVTPLCAHSALVATTLVSTACTVFWHQPLLSTLHAHGVTVITTPHHKRQLNSFCDTFY